LEGVVISTVWALIVWILLRLGIEWVVSALVAKGVALLWLLWLTGYLCGSWLWLIARLLALLPPGYVVVGVLLASSSASTEESAAVTAVVAAEEAAAELGLDGNGEDEDEDGGG